MRRSIAGGAGGGCGSTRERTRGMGGEVREQFWARHQFWSPRLR